MQNIRAVELISFELSLAFCHDNCEMLKLIRYSEFKKKTKNIPVQTIESKFTLINCNVLNENRRKNCLNYIVVISRVR